MSKSLSCRACRSPIRVGQAFCANCGARLDEAPVTEPQPEVEAAPVVEAAVEAAPVVEAAPALDRTLQPSATVTVGSRPWESIPSTAAETTLVPPAPPTAPAAPATPPAGVKAALALPETAQELVAFGLGAAGTALAIASFFLPWTGVSGVGIGSTGAKVVSNQWAFAMPAAVPMLLISVLALAAITVSDRAQVELPRFALVIARITDIFLPLILGGLYLGVALLYMTLPYGYGTGIVVLIMAAAVLIGGAAVAVAFPPHSTSKPE